ncbi:hypothetical protein ACFO5U_12655 [Planococcus dechangensis]|uniref:Uncharacterized protein n=1 Tax=Planococcus dechangensis TaxID=1176255 RepID=A0ABV9MFD3_9BACL
MQIWLNNLHTTKSLSRLASRVSRRSETGALSGLLQEAIPKQGGGFISDALNEP